MMRASAIQLKYFEFMRPAMFLFLLPRNLTGFGLWLPRN